MLKPAALVVLAAACAAAQTTRMSAEEISSRIREQLEAKGVRLPDVLRQVERSRERPASPKAKNGTKGAEDPDAEAITRIANTYRRIYKIYQTVGALDSMPDLYVNTEPVINAYAADGQEIHMYLALSELLQDSDSELAFVLGHEMGHIVQQRTGRFLFVYDNEEFDADVWGALVCLVAGYDPYAGSAALSKLSMATGDVGLAQQFERQNSADAHKSFVSRIEIMYLAFKAVCGINVDFQNTCEEYRSTVHPHFPSSAVL